MMRLIIKDDGRIELIPEEDKDRARLALVPEGSNEVFVYTTLDGGDDGGQEALVIHIGRVPSLEEILEDKDPTELSYFRAAGPFVAEIKLREGPIPESLKPQEAS